MHHIKCKISLKNKVDINQAATKKEKENSDKVQIPENLTFSGADTGATGGAWTVQHQSISI